MLIWDYSASKTTWITEYIKQDSDSAETELWNRSFQIDGTSTQIPAGDMTFGTTVWLMRANMTQQKCWLSSLMFPGYLYHPPGYWYVLLYKTLYLVWYAVVPVAIGGMTRTLMSVNWLCGRSVLRHPTQAGTISQMYLVHVAKAWFITQTVKCQCQEILTVYQSNVEITCTTSPSYVGHLDHVCLCLTIICLWIAYSQVWRCWWQNVHSIGNCLVWRTS